MRLLFEQVIDGAVSFFFEGDFEDGLGLELDVVLFDVLLEF